MKLHVCAVCALAAACGNVERSTEDASVTPPDAPPGKTDVTFSQTNSEAVELCLGCRTVTTEYIRDNSMYRAFPLADYGVAGKLTIKRVRFGVCSTTTPEASGSQPVTV